MKISDFQKKSEKFRKKSANFRFSEKYEQIGKNLKISDFQKKS
jgi:hypothetical protein